MSAKTESAYVKQNTRPVNIPAELKAIPKWALVSKDKKAITVKSEALPGRGHQRLARSNVDEDLTDYDTARREFSRASDYIIGLGVVLSRDSRVVCIDLDYQEGKQEDKVRDGLVTRAQADNFYAKSREIIDSTVTEFAKIGAYIERSLSGKSYHIMFLADTEHARYEFGAFGHVFTDKQFLYVTGDRLLPDSGKSPDLWQRDLTVYDPPSKLLDLTDAFKAFEEHWIKHEGLRPQGSDTGDGEFADNVSLLLADYTAHGRRLDLSDEQVLNILKSFSGLEWEAYLGEPSWSAKRVPGGDWSADTRTLMGSLDKITGSSEQVKRILQQSPRMRNAGWSSKVLPDGRVVNNRNRWDRLFVENNGKIFNEELMKCRNSNDRWFASGKTIHIGPAYHNSDASAHGASIIESFLAAKHATPAPLPEQSILPPLPDILPQDAPPSTDPNAGAGAPHASTFMAQSAQEDHKQVLANLRNRRASSDPAKTQAIAARDFLACGIHQQFLNGDTVPPGKCGEMCVSAYRAMYEPMLKFAVPATLAFISGVISRKYKVEGESAGPVLNFIVCAQSATGKSQSIGVIESLFGEVSTDTYHHKNRVYKGATGSVQGFHSHLEEVPSCLWVIDECKASLKSIVNPMTEKDNNFQSFFNQLFDASRANSVTKPYTSIRSKKDGENPIYNLSVATYWGTTISNITEFFTKDVVDSGLPSRLLVVTHKGASAIEQDPSQMLRKLPQEQSDLIKQLLTLAADTDENYRRVGPGADCSHLTSTVGFDPHAMALHNHVRIKSGSFKRDVQNQKGSFGPHYLALARLSVVTARVAAILAVCDNPHNPVISYYHYAWSLGYCLNVICSFMHSFDTDLIGTTRGDANSVAMRVIYDLSNRDSNDGKNYLERHACIREMRKRLPFRTADTGPVASNSSHKMAEETLESLGRDGIVTLDVIRPSTKPLKVVYMNPHPAWDSLSI